MAENRQYARLFQAKVLTLLATGVATVELAVIAVGIAGQDASALLGTALSFKALSFIVAPFLMAAVVARLPRGQFLIVLDLVRAAAIFGLIFVASELSFLAVIAVFLAASAAFKVTYLEYVAHLLPDRDEFAAAMSKSRIIDELESAVSPLLAAALLLLLPMDLFLLCTGSLFLVSALRTARARLPDLGSARAGRQWWRGLDGLGLLVADAGLRPVTWLMVAVAAGTAMVMTNTPGLVESAGDYEASAIALAFGAFGAGAVAGALASVWIVRSLGEGATMLAGGALVTAGLFGGVVFQGFAPLVVLWFAIGSGITLIQTPAASVLRRVAGARDRLTLYGVGLAMQNAILIVAYLLAGWLAAGAGATTAFFVLAALAAMATILAARLWRGDAVRAPVENLAGEYRAFWAWLQMKQVHREMGSRHDR